MPRHSEMDPLDLEIIRLLQRDGRMAYSAIAEKFHLAEGTVRKRVGRLLAEGQLRIVGVATPSKVGMEVVSIIGLNVSRQKMSQARAHLLRLTPVRYVAITTGTFDYIIEVILPSMQDLLHFLLSDLAGVPGLTHTETSLVWRSRSKATIGCRRRGRCGTKEDRSGGLRRYIRTCLASGGVAGRTPQADRPFLDPRARVRQRR